MPDEPASPVGLEPEDSSELDGPAVAVDPEPLWVLVPTGTVLLPPAPPGLLLPEDMPPVGAAAPPPTTEDTRVVPFTAAGMPCGPAGAEVGATAVLVVATSGWSVTGVGRVVTGSGWVVTTDNSGVGMPVTTPRELVCEV